MEDPKNVCQFVHLPLGGKSNRLMCDWYPGDMDKVGGEYYAIVNDACVAHRLHEWYQNFQKLVEWGANPSLTPQQQSEWKTFAQRFLAKSEEFM